MALAPLKWPRLLAAAGAGIGLLAACAIQLRGDQEATATPQASTKADALDTRLTRCRTVIPEQVDAFEQCRWIWAENRRRFLGKDPSRVATPEYRAADQPFGPRSSGESR